MRCLILKEQTMTIREDLTSSNTFTRIEKTATEAVRAAEQANLAKLLDSGKTSFSEVYILSRIENNTLRFVNLSTLQLINKTVKLTDIRIRSKLQI